MAKTPPELFALFDDQATAQTYYFTRPSKVLNIIDPDDVSQAFDQIEAALARGQYVAGYFAYEVGFALVTKLASRFDPAPTPLIQIGFFDAPSDTPPADFLYTSTPPDISLSPEWSEANYLARFDRLQDYIAAGDCYQVNLTFPMRGQTDAKAHHLYAAFRQRQPGRYGALLSLGGADIISFSPELFFEKRGQEMRMRPMKGTRPRTGKDDHAVAEAMRAEPKSQAENLMIVDLLRNDLSRLAEVGSVKVPELFALETYPTVHQMTSQVTATLRNGIKWQEIFRGLFPCGSVTGAPKIRAMEVIDELETGPRGPYCGAIGFITPSGDASFNVAIRTAVLSEGELRYDVGSGVVSDSDGADEYRECLLKSKIFAPQPETFIETLYWHPDAGYRNEAAHIARMEQACGHKPNPPSFSANTPQRVKWIMDTHGNVQLEHTPYQALKDPLQFAISKYPITPAQQRVDAKVGRRDFYDGERRRVQILMPEIDEVVFFNSAGELTEGSFTSLFIETDGALLTPPLSTGLLPGILRAELIKSGKVKEATLTPQDLKNCDQIWLGNSLRGLMRATRYSSALL